MKKIIIALLIIALFGIVLISAYNGKKPQDNLGVSLQWNKFTAPSFSVHYASTTAGTILTLNYNRQYVNIVNVGTSTAYIWLNTSTDSIVANRGIVLLPSATTTPSGKNNYEIDVSNLYFGPIQVIAPSDTLLYIIEK